ncbi:MAG: hypothetical protein WC483_04210 [Candidatus Paceibacterota bacterium]
MRQSLSISEASSAWNSSISATESNPSDKSSSTRLRSRERWHGSRKERRRRLRRHRGREEGEEVGRPSDPARPSRLVHLIFLDKPLPSASVPRLDSPFDEKNETMSPSDEEDEDEDEKKNAGLLAPQKMLVPRFEKPMSVLVIGEERRGSPRLTSKSPK